MKKTLLLTLALLLSMITFAQSRLSYISEHFDSEDFPSGWSVEGDCTAEHWQIWGTHQAGGEPNEIKLYWKPQFEGVARLVSPAINLTGVSEMVVSFKAYLDNYKDIPHKMGVATTSDNGTTWNLAWEDYYSNNNQGQHNIVRTIVTPDMGKENVKFCIFFEGVSGNINGWYFDDIEIYTLDKLNLGLMSIDIPEIAGATDNEISFTVKNTGEETVTSFSASYKIDDNETVTQDFEATIESLKEASFVFEEEVDLLPGSHELTISILNVNGEEDITTDNIMTIEMNVAISRAERKPMIEHFSSPTCAPCVAVNQQMVLLTEKYHGQYTYTKYPANFPQEGDPYYTDECKVRKTYYNVLAAPTLFLNGDLYGNTFIIEQDFEKALNTPAYIDIRGAFDINENDSTITINVDVMPFINLYKKRIYVSVNEKTTTGNASYNGETEFHHIMMKMIPDAEGIEMDFKAGELQHFEFSCDMNETYMEELNDLEVAIWIQDYYDYIIYNSNYAYEYTEHSYPVQNLQLAYDEKDMTLTTTWEAPEKGNPLGYNVYINDNLVAENISELSYTMENASGLLVAKVVALYENEKTSVGMTDLIITEVNTESIDENTTSLNIYPNPVGNKLFIATELRVEEISIYDIYGRKTTGYGLQSTDFVHNINVADLEAGIYFINIKTENGNVVRRFVKQ